MILQYLVGWERHSSVVVALHLVERHVLVAHEFQHTPEVSLFLIASEEFQLAVTSEALRANSQDGRSGSRPPRIKQIAHQSTIILWLIIGYSSSIGAFLSSAAMPICSGCIGISFACGREASLTFGVYASMMWRQSLTVIPP